MQHTKTLPGKTAGHLKQQQAGELPHKLAWLMAARVAFTAILLISTILTQYRINDPAKSGYLEVLYWFAGSVFLLSIAYAWISTHIGEYKVFGLIQMVVDSLLATLIVYITGGYFSFFVSLYLVVVICASVILGLKKGIAISVVGTLFYGTMLMLQYAGGLPLFGIEEGQALRQLSWLTIVYRIANMAAASIAVAILCGLLIEQKRKNAQKLAEMEEYVHRVAKMAHMGEMAAGLAHEIRNPLASLSGSIQILAADLACGDDHRQLMKIVMREAERLNKLVNEFLFFARPPAGNREELNLTETLEEVCRLFEKDANLARTRFALIRNFTEETFWIFMDPAHLRQVLWNLLLNAAEAVAPGGRIVIEMIRRKNQEVQVCVSDNGGGIAQETLPLIFNPFFTTKSEGTGLGLSIVHRILEGYQSRLRVVTEVGKGTTFSFPLKLAPTATAFKSGRTASSGKRKSSFRSPSDQLLSNPPAC